MTFAADATMPTARNALSGSSEELAYSVGLIATFGVAAISNV
nr:hypothetical protein [uncultured bacterium]